MKAYLIPWIVVGFCACQAPRAPGPVREDEDGRIVSDRAAVQSEATPVQLDATPVPPDATLVPAAEPGSVRVVQEPIRAVEGVSSGKVWLLELYQSTLADKEALVRRLEASERERAASHTAQAAVTAERDELAARRTELDKRVRELEAQSLELARRLADSEIARLEAQKAELELAAQNDRKERP